MAYAGTLTDEQITDVVATQDEWMRVGLSTERCDRPAADAAVRAAYRAAGLAEPRLVVWMDSPMGGVYALGQLGGQLWGQLWGQLRGQLGDQLGGQLRGQLGGQLAGQLRDQLRGQLDPWYDSFWLAFYGLALPITGLPRSERLDTLTDAVKRCGWWWPYRDVAVLTDRPTAIHRDGRGRLHNPDGPALAYADGYGLWVWHGQRVPRELIDGRWTVDEILRQPNVEIRRCAIERMGWPEFVARAGLRQVGSPVPDPGNPGQSLTLYDVPEQVFTAPTRLLVCVNGTVERDGTRRGFGLTVPADIQTPLQAQAWIHTDPDHPIAVTEDTYAALGRRC